MTATVVPQSPRPVGALAAPGGGDAEANAEAAVSVTAGLPTGRRRTLRLVIGAALVAAFAQLGYTIAGAPVGADAANWIGDSSMFGAVVLCLWRAVAVGHERASWLLIGAGLSSWLFGDCYWNLALSTLSSPPVPSWGDLGYLLFYPLAGAGLILQIRHAAGSFPQGFVLDWTIGGLAVVAIMATVVFPDVLSISGGDLAQVVTNLAYPIGDLALLALLVGGLQLSGWRPSGVWAFFGFGLVLSVAGDSIFLYQSAAGSYVDGTPLDALWTLGVLAMGLAAWRPVPTRLGQRARWSASRPLAGFALSAVAILVWDHFNPLTATAAALAGLTLLAVVVRLLWALQVNSQLVVERQQEAYTDDVTGLANHRALLEVLHTELQRARRYARPVSVLFMDLDYFKSINDTCGHDAGDRTLGEFGEVVSAALRGMDTVGRWGGEEFVAVLSETGLQGATETAERICQQVAEHRFAATDGVTVTCSIGVAEFPSHGLSSGDLLRRADEAMYEAKRAGRNRVLAAGTADAHRVADVRHAPGEDPRSQDLKATPATPEPRTGRWWHWHLWPDAELDPFEFEFRRDSVPASVKATVMLCVPTFAYAAVAARPEGRVAVCAMVVVALVGALLALRLPWERILRSRFREAYIIAWWLIDFAAVMAATVLDGGPRSPLLLVVFVLLVFMGFSYPQFDVIVLGTVSLFGYAALAFAYGEEPTRAVFIAAALVATGTMSYWQTRNQSRRHRALESSKGELEAALRRAETSKQALQQSERRLSEAQEIAHIGSWEWEQATNRLTVSAELLRIMGLRWNEFDSTLEGYLACVHPTDREEVAGRMRASTEKEGTFSYEHRIVRPDGSVRSLLIHGNAVLDERRPARSWGICQDLTELRAIEARLQHLAEHDALTGLLNRRRLAGEVDRELGRRESEDRAGALLILDLDGFGFYNDSFGQPAGDGLLRAVAAALIGEFTAGEVVARSGGDQFAVVLPNASEQSATAVAEDLRGLLAGCSPGSPITVSVGIAMFEQSHARAGDEVLASADIALHDAKERGGNRVAVYRGQTDVDMSWVQRIRAALSDGRFVLYGQPVVSLNGDAESYSELLIRMIDDDGGVIAPDTFLPSAERFGVINDIDRWVVSVAIGLARSGKRVALNLSARSIGDERIVGMLREAISGGLAPANLIFEITETATITNLAEAREFAGALSALGCDLAIDDYGTGFASLSYLKHIPARYVKIDVEFITDLTRSETDRSLVASIVSVAQSLGKLTVAEGIEDEATLVAVRELGVDFAQGFYTGRPQRISPLTAFERRNEDGAREFVAAHAGLAGT